MTVVAVAVFVDQTEVTQSQLTVEGITYSEVILVVVVVVMVVVVVVVFVVVGVVVVVVVVVIVVLVVVVVVVVAASVVEVVEVFKVVVDIIDEVVTVVVVVVVVIVVLPPVCPDLMASEYHVFVVEKISNDFSHTNFDLYNRSRLFLPSGQLNQELHVDQAVQINQEAQTAPSDIEWHSYCYCLPIQYMYSHLKLFFVSNQSQNIYH